jgi:hypothetical protein
MGSLENVGSSHVENVEWPHVGTAVPGCPPGKGRQPVWNGHSCPLPLILTLLLILSG